VRARVQARKSVPNGGVVYWYANAPQSHLSQHMPAPPGPIYVHPPTLVQPTAPPV